MRNPYEVLGIQQGASAEQINAAYKKLLREYHASGQTAKIDELNEAYDAVIVSSHSAPDSGSSYGRGNDYSDIRSQINSGRLDDAQTLLDGIPQEMRDAQWYYLKGIIHQKRGWLEEAAKNFATACNLNPSNNTYKAAYNKINSARSGGYRTERRKSNPGCSPSKICAGLLCADCCCECFGGDLIKCC